MTKTINKSSWHYKLNSILLTEDFLKKITWCMYWGCFSIAMLLSSILSLYAMAVLAFMIAPVIALCYDAPFNYTMWLAVTFDFTVAGILMVVFNPQIKKICRNIKSKICVPVEFI